MEESDIQLWICNDTNELLSSVIPMKCIKITEENKQIYIYDACQLKKQGKWQSTDNAQVYIKILDPFLFMLIENRFGDDHLSLGKTYLNNIKAAKSL